MKEPTKDQHHNQWDETFPWSWKPRVNQQVHCPLERARKRKGKAVKDPKVAHQMVNNNDQDLHRVLIICQLPPKQLATSIPDLPSFYETKFVQVVKSTLGKTQWMRLNLTRAQLSGKNLGVRWSISDLVASKSILVAKNFWPFGLYIFSQKMLKWHKSHV